MTAEQRELMLVASKKIKEQADIIKKLNARIWVLELELDAAIVSSKPKENIPIKRGLGSLKK